MTWKPTYSLGKLYSLERNFRKNYILKLFHRYFKDFGVNVSITFFVKHMEMAAFLSISQKVSMKTHTAQKMKFSIKDFCSKCDQIPQIPVDSVTFTEEILHGKLHFLYSVIF